MASKKTKDFLYYLIIFFEVVVLITLVAILIFVCIPLLVKTVSPTRTPKIGQETFFSKSLSVGQLYENISLYVGKTVKVRGEVNFAPVVCQSMECPKEDPCCGCPEKRDLMLTTKDKIFVPQEAQVKLVERNENEPLCERKMGFCDYMCKGWDPGNTYLVEGVFFVEKPPRGMTLARGYLTAYFKVSDKEKLSKPLISPGKLLNEMIQFLKQASKDFRQVRLQ